MSLTLSVTKIEAITAKIRLIELTDTNGGALPVFTAGAHIEIDTGKSGLRSYSLITWSQPTPAPVSYCIAVQLEDAGEGGSAFMHTLTQGQSVEISEPKNDFQLSGDDQPCVLIAGGIGVTPIISMAATLRNQHRSFQLHYSGRSRSFMAFADEMDAAFSDSLSIYTDDNKPIDIDQVIKNIDPRASVYLCGPKGMIESVRSKALASGISKEQIHVELFTSAQAEAGDRSFEIELASSGQVYVVPVGKTIIDVLEAEGVDLMFDCQRGDCGICQTDVLNGIPDHRDLVLSTEERDSGKVMQICVSRAKSDRLVLDI